MKDLWIIAICWTAFIHVSRSQNATISFPATNFQIGVATAAYQIEGAWNASGKGESVWDYFTHNKPERIADGSNGDIACDSYNKYEKDVDLIADLGVDFYRFSISWARILPNGFADKVSEDGIQYYKNLINALVARNITPVVTIYHWDHPQILEELGGWTNEMMVEWFTDYARVVFEELGPLVQTFNTINEPSIYCLTSYDSELFAPGKTLENMGQYLCVHNVLKAHAKAYHLYDEEFRPTQKGEIGILTACDGWVAGPDVTDDSIEQYFQFNCGWIMNPIYIGDYPEIMKTRIAKISALEGYPFSRLPEFSAEWVEYIKGTSDFFGLNHYSSKMPVFDPEEARGIYSTDSGIILNIDPDWSIVNGSWIHVLPEGLSNVLHYIRDHYDNPPVYILENGCSDSGESQDYDRITYYHGYFGAVLTAVNEDGCNVQKYTIWSLMDAFEWAAGYTSPFGITSVDFDSDDLTRTPKLSSIWWKKVIQTRMLQDVPEKDS